MGSETEHAPYCADAKCESCLRHLRQERRDVFVDCISDYERLRGYLVLRYNDNSTNSEVATWLAENGGGLIVEGVPEADEWRERFWPSPSTQPDNQGQRLTDDEVDEMVQGQYEEALVDGEPWAEESFAYRHPADGGEP